MSKMPNTYEADTRSYDEIVLAARQMRADYMRDLFGRLRASLFGARAGHGGMTPQAH